MTKPSDFFVGVVEFFSVLLPGAFLAYATRLLPGDLVFGRILPPLDKVNRGTENWIVFVFASYVIGHFVFQAGSLLDHSYDKWYRPRKAASEGDDLFRTAAAMKCDLENVPNTVSNAFKWASAYVRTHSPSAIALVDQFEASQKFFRSMVIAFTVYALLCVGTGRWLGAALFVLLAYFSYVRFGDLRWKMTQAAYLFYVQLRSPSMAKATAGSA
jgi:hypothetical protein